MYNKKTRSKNTSRVELERDIVEIQGTDVAAMRTKALDAHLAELAEPDRTEIVI